MPAMRAARRSRMAASMPHLAAQVDQVADEQRRRPPRAPTRPRARATAATTPVEQRAHQQREHHPLAEGVARAGRSRRRPRGRTRRGRGGSGAAGRSQRPSDVVVGVRSGSAVVDRRPARRARRRVVLRVAAGPRAVGRPPSAPLRASRAVGVRRPGPGAQVRPRRPPSSVGSCPLQRSCTRRRGRASTRPARDGTAGTRHLLLVPGDRGDEDQQPEHDQTGEDQRARHGCLLPRSAQYGQGGRPPRRSTRCSR